MPQTVRLASSKDTVYTINGYGALGGLQRFQYSYAANEEDIDELGSAVSAATTSDPETSISFEVTDTGTLASLLARMRYDYTSQAYAAGVTNDITTNAFSFDQDDLEFMIFTAGEYKSPGDTFDQCTIFPFHFIDSLSFRLTSDGIGSVTFDANGALFKPIYKPYHTTRAYPVTFATTTTADIAAGWSVNSGTHNVLALEVDNQIIEEGNLAWSDSDTVVISGGSTISAENRLMLWAFERTPGTAPAIDYVDTIRFVKPDRINIWLMPEADTATLSNNMLRVQALDLTVNLSREELREIAKNDQATSIFFQAPQYPLDITGQVRIIETDLTKWAELQGKTLNESATTSTIDTDNVLNISDFGTLKLIVEWYKYTSNSPMQRMICSGVSITGYDSSVEVGGRKEGTWSITTSAFNLEGFDI